MNDPEKFEFCSKEWVRVADEYLKNATRGADLAGVDFTMCECIASAPAHLVVDELGRTGWYFRISENEVCAEHGVREDADLVVFTDYEAILPLGRLVFEGDPKALEQAKRINQELSAQGKLKYKAREGGNKMPELECLNLLHDVLARQTQ